VNYLRQSAYFTRIQANRFMARALVLAILAANPLFAAADDAAATWAQVVGIRQAASVAMESIQAEFSQTFRDGPEENPESLDANECTFAIDGDKKFARTIFNSKGKRFETVATFDGTILRRRYSNRPGVMLITRDPKAQVFGARLPLSTIEYQSPKDLDERLRAGSARILSAQYEALGDTKCLKMVWEVQGAGPYRYEVWYDTEHGYLPKLTQVYDPDNNLSCVIDGVEFETVVVDENRFFFPKSGKRDVFDHGKSLLQWKFQVKANSVIINADIPDGKFILRPQPGEKIYNSDLGIYVVDPAKGVSLNEDIVRATKGDEEANPPSPTTKSNLNRQQQE